MKTWMNRLDEEIERATEEANEGHHLDMGVPLAEDDPNVARLKGFGTMFERVGHELVAFLDGVRQRHIECFGFLRPT